MAAQLSPPGSSTYNSGTMTVGDGTWDSSRNSFLLPNLVGLNFQTMRYNGMGNRFRDLPGYKNIIVGHAVMAAITFLGIVPAAIFLAKYGRVWPGTRWSFKLHVYLQILTVFLSTVVLVLGWFAVGPERSLSNPHHGIGVAIYVLIIWQFIYGTFMYRRERRRSSFPNRLPLGVWIHKLQGRALALLAITQIALGLTLYGSPKILFILYALWIFFLIFAYLGLEFHYRDGYQGGGRPSGGGQPEFYSDYGSYLSGSRVGSRPAPRKKESHWGRNILAGAGALGAYEWWKHRRDGRKEGREERYEESIDSRSAGPPPQGPMGPPPMGPSMGPPGPPGPMGPMGPPPMGGPPMGPPMGPPPMGPPPPRGYARNTRPPNGSRISRESWEDEKYSEPPRNTWRNRILGVTGAYAAYEGARSLFGRRRREDDYSDRSYTPPPGAQNVVSTHDVSRVEAGQAPTSPATPRVNMGGGQPMTPSMTPGQDAGRSGPAPGGTDLSYDSRDYDYTLRESMAEYGPLAGFREWNRARKMRREGDRTEAIRRQQIDSEQDYNRRNSNVYPLPQDADTRRASMSGTLLTGPSGVDPNAPPPPDGYLRPDTSHPPLPADAGTIPASSQYAGSRHDVRTDQNYSLPPPPPGPPPGAVRPDGYSPPQFGSARMPEGAVNPDPNRLVSENTAMNEASAYGRDPRGESVSAAAVSRDNISASPSRPSGSRNRLTKNSSMTSASASGIAGPAKQPNSPPVSVKVKMANDGRTVTLRRLPEEEAAAERAARRQDRRSRRRRNSSLSSGIEDDLPSGPRYRRTAPIRPSNDQPIANIPPPPPMSSSAGASLRRDSELNLPPAGAPPPPVPQHSVSPGSRQDLSSPPPTGGVNDSGFLSPGDAGTGTDISAFADNRRRRRAERARQAASRGGNKVEFE